MCVFFFVCFDVVIVVVFVHWFCVRFASLAHLLKRVAQTHWLWHNKPFETVFLSLLGMLNHCDADRRRCCHRRRRIKWLCFFFNVCPTSYVCDVPFLSINLNCNIFIFGCIPFFSSLIRLDFVYTIKIVQGLVVSANFGDFICFRCRERQRDLQSVCQASVCSIHFVHLIASVSVESARLLMRVASAGPSQLSV